MLQVAGAAVLFTAITLAQLRVTTQQIAALYSNTLEKSAVEFAVDYINQQVVAGRPFYWSTTLNISEITNNETTRRDAACDILSNASGLVVPKLTQLSYETAQNIIYNTQFPIIVGQNMLTSVAVSNNTVIWRSTANELLDVIRNLLVHINPAVMVVVESTEDVAISLSSVLPDKLVLSDDVIVDIIIVRYNSDDNLTDKVKNAAINASLVANASSTINTSCAQTGSQSEIVFILNSPACDANTSLTQELSTSIPEICNATLGYRWLLLPHLTSYLVDELITTNELGPFPAHIQGLQVDSLSTQEFVDFQNHWLSANKSAFPDSSFDAAEFAYDVYKAVLTLLDLVNMSNYDNTMFNCSSMSATYALPPASGDASISHRNYTFSTWSGDAGFARIDDGCTSLDTETNTESTDMQFQNNFTGVHFKVVTIPEIPFVMNNNGEFEGYCIDMLNELRDMMGFTYEIYEVEDKQFGSQQDDGTWNGIIDDIIQEKANLSVASLTINVDRIKVVDFTKPYIELGTLILLYKEPEMGFSLLRWTEPFSGCLLFIFVICWPIVGFVAWIAARYSPYDWSALKKEKKVDALYGFSYSMWAQYGSLTLQGSEYHPLSPSGRIVVVTWWFVILVLISCYTAQLAATLTTGSIARVINSINDLTNQDHVKYGTVNNSEVHDFFSSSNITTYRSALPTIRNNLYPTVDAAVDEVCESEGRFAFIWDSIVIDSLIAQADDCGLCSVGTLFDRKGYGLALPFNSSYANDFTIAILKLRESQFLLTLRNKWIPTSDSSTCEESSALQYTVTDIGDAFVVLAICLVVSFVVLLIEILWKYFAISQKIEDIVKNLWKSIKVCGNSNRTVPASSEYHQDNGSAIKNGEALSGPTEDADTTSLKSASHLLNNSHTVFVKEKQSLQESA